MSKIKYLLPGIKVSMAVNASRLLLYESNPDLPVTCRVSARAELSLRRRLSQREDRISELKDALAVARSHHHGTHTNHSRQPSPSPQHYLSDHMHQPQDRHYSSAAMHTQSEGHSPRGQFQQRPRRHPQHQQGSVLSLDTSDTQQEEEEEVRQTASPRGRSHHGVSSFRAHREEREQGGARVSPRARSYQVPRADGSPREEEEYVGPAVAARLPYFCPGSQAHTGQSQSGSEDVQGTHVNPQTQLAHQPAKAAQNASGAGLGTTPLCYCHLDSKQRSSEHGRYVQKQHVDQYAPPVCLLC